MFLAFKNYSTCPRPYLFYKFIIRDIRATHNYKSFNVMSFEMTKL